jgi:arginine decarboxylase
VADEIGVVPTLGVRIKLTTTGSGRWSETAGEKSKFGLNASQVVRVLDKLEAAGRLDTLKLIHFHLGSQIPDIRNIKLGMAEVARFYVELRTIGVGIEYVDVGGGLGVDYDGSRSTSSASVNYSVQEYANDIIYGLAEACRENEIPMPHVISESGRALTAHHALLLINVVDLETQVAGEPEPVDEDAHPLVQELAATLKEVGVRNTREVYHDTSFAKQQMQLFFNSGSLSLRERASAERYWLAIMNRVGHLAAADPEEYEDILPELSAILVDRYFCNFSLFQSLPDSWAIDQLFPIMPVHRLDEEPTRRGTLQDMTCDSDGKIDSFVGWRKAKPSLELHTFRHDEPYVLGIFLTGAYQEILGDLHNLFGDTNAVHIRLTDGGYEIGDLVHGDTVTEVLNYVQFNSQDLIATFRRKVQKAKGITRRRPTPSSRITSRGWPGTRTWRARGSGKESAGLHVESARAEWSGRSLSSSFRPAAGCSQALPFASVDARLAEDPDQQLPPDVAPVRVRYPDGCFTPDHELVLPSGKGAVEPEPEKITNQVPPADRAEWWHQPTLRMRSSTPSSWGTGRLREMRKKIHSSSTSSSSSRHASSVSPSE